jgi:hypothetical protein
MLFFRQLVTGFVLAVMLWVAVSAVTLGVGGVVIGSQVAQEHHADDFAAWTSGWTKRRTEFARRYGIVISLGALVIAVLGGVAISYSSFFPWCRAPIDQPVSSTSWILDRLTAAVLIFLSCAAAVVLSLLAHRRQLSGNGAQAQAALAASPVGTLASFNPQAVHDAKVEAVRIYPDLAIAGSPMNAEYVARYDRYRVENPRYFLDTNWPLTLANETATAMRAAGTQPAQPVAKATPSPVATATPSPAATASPSSTPVQVVPKPSASPSPSPSPSASPSPSTPIPTTAPASATPSSPAKPPSTNPPTTPTPTPPPSSPQPSHTPDSAL